MAICVDPHRTYRYVLKADRALPTEQRSVFLIKPITESAEKESAVAAKVSGAHVVWSLLRAGLVGWENFPAGGECLPFNKDGNGQPSSDTLLRITSDDRDEIATAISKLGKLTEADLGN